MNRVWTKKMDMKLIDMIGLKTHSEIANYFGKSVDAIRRRAHRLGHSLNQGTYSLRQLARETGYDRHQLRRAQTALRQQWRRTKNRYLISGEQADALVDYLGGET